MIKQILLFLILSSPIWAQPFGSVLLLDGNDYVDCGNDASLNINDALTLEAWVNTSAISNSRIISKYGSGSGYEMDFLIDEAWLTINQSQRAAYTASSLVGQWTHIAMTYDGVNSAIYFNGIPVATGINSQQSIVNTGLNLFIGNISNGANAYFIGSIDEVRIWNRERTQAEIQSTMNSTLGSIYYNSADSGLVGYWQFEEVINDSVYDLSVHTNHGLLHGALITDVSHNKISSALPSKFSLAQNHPNPFNPSTTIKFSLAQPGNTTITIFNALGQKELILLNRSMTAGDHALDFNAHDLPSGIYFYRIKSGGFQQVKKMVVLK